jgi:hypothetical protein
VNLSYEKVWAGLGETRQWQRVVIVPVVRAYPVEAVAGESILAPFMVRADLHAPGDAVPVSMGELIHERCFLLLHGWMPGPMEDVQVRHRIYRVTSPEPIPVKDPEADVSTMSAEYRVLMESPDV